MLMKIHMPCLAILLLLLACMLPLPARGQCLQTPVLIVDDSPRMRIIVRNLFRQVGLPNVEEAASADEALAKLQKGGFGLIISDNNLPDGSGYQFVKRVRANARIARIPFILITTESRVSDGTHELRATGVSAVLVKPFNAETLHKHLQAIGLCRYR